MLTTLDSDCSWQFAFNLSSLVSRRPISLAIPSSFNAPHREKIGNNNGLTSCEDTVSRHRLFSLARSRRNFGLAGPSQHVGGQVGLVCYAFANYAAFSDFDLSNPGESDPRCLAPETNSAAM
jgi:hypothetical protein